MCGEEPASGLAQDAGRGVEWLLGELLGGRLDRQRDARGQRRDETLEVEFTRTGDHPGSSCLMAQCLDGGRCRCRAVTDLCIRQQRRRDGRQHIPLCPGPEELQEVDEDGQILATDGADHVDGIGEVGDRRVRDELDRQGQPVLVGEVGEPSQSVDEPGTFVVVTDGQQVLRTQFGRDLERRDQTVEVGVRPDPHGFDVEQAHIAFGQVAREAPTHMRVADEIEHRLPRIDGHHTHTAHVESARGRGVREFEWCGSEPCEVMQRKMLCCSRFRHGRGNPSLLGQRDSIGRIPFL